MVSRSAGQLEKLTVEQNVTGASSTDALPRPVSLITSMHQPFTADRTLQSHEGLGFDTLLVQLAATFATVPADQLDAQIKSALRQIVEFLKIDWCMLGEVSTAGNLLVITHSYEVPGVPPPRAIADEQSLWYTTALRAGEAVRFSRLPDDLPPEALSEREYCIRVGLKSVMMIPLKLAGSIVGGIGFASFRADCEWPDELIPRLRLVGDILTNALARRRADEALLTREHSLKQTREGLRKLAAKLLHAQEEERRRIAREMHDDWTQRLALACIDLVKLAQYIGMPEVALPLLQTVQEQLVRLSEDVHCLSRQLHPSILDDLGLVEALRSECASFSRREGIAVIYRPEDVPSTLSKDVALCVYRVAQEALRNVAKHAAVNDARVVIAASGPELVLRVEDDGVGFDAASVRSEPGLGLSSMEERVRLVQGQLTIVSAPGRGTAVEVRVTIARREP
jgi:signal transduction histidine kinase